MIKLHDYWRSTASYRVRIALGLAGLPWTTNTVNLLDGDQKSQEHLKLNPQGLVPVLEIDGAILTQSLAQIEYLNETRDLCILPENATERAHVRALAYAIAMEIHPVCNPGVVTWAVSNSDGSITTERWMEHFLQNGLVAYEGMLEGGDYSFDSRVTLADICLVPQLYNAQRWGIDLQQFPKICRIHSVLEGIPAFANAHPDMSPKH